VKTLGLKETANESMMATISYRKIFQQCHRKFRRLCGRVAAGKYQGSYVR